MVDISEKNFEATLEATLLAGGSDAAPGGVARELPTTGFVPGGYHKRTADEYDKALCLIRRDAYDFVIATQPKAWDKFKKQYKDEAQDKFFQRLAHEIRARGTLDVLRKGIKANGCKF